MSANLLDFATHAELTANSTPAWNAALAQLTASTSDRSLKIPAGKLTFGTAPNPITAALNIVGEGHVATTLIRGYQGVGFIKWIGQGEMYGGAAGAIRDLSIDAGGFTQGVGLWIQAQPETDGSIGSRNPHGVYIENVFCLAGHYYPNAGNWAIPFYLDGSINATPPAGVAAGVRNTRILNCGGSQYTSRPLYMDYAYGTRVMGFDGWVPIGAGVAEIYCAHDLGSSWIYSVLPVNRVD